MDLKKLKYLEAVYRLGNITAAAKEQYVSQPAMTKAIRLLEKELGTELMVRTPGGVIFTESGELFMRHVRIILTAVDNAEREMQDLNDHSAGRVAIGVSNTAQVWLLPMIYSDFKRRHPDFIVEYKESTQEGMLNGLIGEELDLIFSILPRTGLPEELTSIPLMPGEIRLVIPQDHPLAMQYDKFIPFYELNDVDIFSYPKGSVIRSMIEEECDRAGVSVRCINACIQLHTNYELVGKGAGITHMICDRMTPDINYPGLVTRSFEQPIYLEEGLIFKNGHYLNYASRMLARYIRGLV